MHEHLANYDLRECEMNERIEDEGTFGRELGTGAKGRIVVGVDGSPSGVGR